MARYWIISCSERTSTRSNPRASGVGRPTLELQYAHPLHGDALPPVRDAPVEARKLSIRSMLEPGKGPYRRKPARLASGFMRARAAASSLTRLRAAGVQPTRGALPVAVSGVAPTPSRRRGAARPTEKLAVARAARASGSRSSCAPGSGVSRSVLSERCLRSYPDGRVGLAGVHDEVWSGIAQGHTSILGHPPPVTRIEKILRPSLSRDSIFPCGPALS